MTLPLQDENRSDRPKLLDLFCCQGGAGRGYHDAGFDVYGVDIEAQPRYPFAFHQGDALDVLTRLIAGEAIPFTHPDGRVEWLTLADFEAVHASPTCQTRARVTAWRGDRANHPDTLTPTLELLAGVWLPWVVENVPEAAADRTMRPDFMLCGSMFGLPIRRHRVFETNWPAPLLVQPCRHRPTDLPFMHKGERAFADAMGCNWMTNRGGRQAIPPAYTRHIGEQLLTHLSEAVA